MVRDHSRFRHRRKRDGKIDGRGRSDARRMGLICAFWKDEKMEVKRDIKGTEAQSDSGY